MLCHGQDLDAKSLSNLAISSSVPWIQSSQERDSAINDPRQWKSAGRLVQCTKPFSIPVLKVFNKISLKNSWNPILFSPTIHEILTMHVIVGVIRR